MVERWRNENAPCKGFLDCRHEVGHHSGLHDISKSARGQTSANEFRVRVNRQENNLGPAAGHLQFIGSLDAIQNRHGNITDDDIGLKFHCGFKQGLAIGHPTDNFERGSQEADHCLQQEGMVIGQEYAHFAQWARLFNAS
jgi:hypothetical protein